MRIVVALLAAALATAATAGAAAKPAAPPPHAVAGGGGVLYGEHHAAMLQAPAGWIFDDESGRKDGLEVVLYRQGESWSKAQGVMYALGDDTADGKRPDLAGFIAEDVARVRKESPKVQTFAIADIELRDHTHARVVGFRGDAWGSIEAVAYIPQDAAVLVLSLSTHSQARFDRDLPDFRSFVRSYQALDVQIRRGP
jgi:hypothetical protein